MILSFSLYPRSKVDILNVFEQFCATFLKNKLLPFRKTAIMSFSTERILKKDNYKRNISYIEQKQAKSSFCISMEKSCDFSNIFST